MDFFKGLYRQLCTALGGKGLQKEYEELINIFRTAVPLDTPDLDAIENALRCIVRNKNVLKERFTLLRSAFKQHKQLGSDVKSRYSVFIANEHDRLAKRRIIDKNRDVSYGVNGNIVYGDVDSNEENEYFTGENVKALNSEPFREKYCAFDCESTKCKSCIEARLRKEITKKLQLEEELKREERIKKRRMENDGRVVTALNEKLGCPLIIARSLTDDAFTLDELESDDREEFLRWKERNRQLAKKINGDIFKGGDASGGVFVEAEPEREKGRIVINRSVIAPVNNTTALEVPKETGALNNPFAESAVEESAQPFNLQNLLSKEKIEPIATNLKKQSSIVDIPATEETSTGVDTTPKIGAAFETGNLVDDRGNEELPRKRQAEVPFTSPAQANPTDMLSNRLRNPFTISTDLNVKMDTENRVVENSSVVPVKPEPATHSIPITIPPTLSLALDNSKPITPFGSVPSKQETQAPALPFSGPKFSFDNPFQSDNKPSNMPLGLGLGKSLILSELAGSTGVAADLSSSPATPNNSLVINATETSPLSSIVGSSPFSNNGKGLVSPFTNTGNSNSILTLKNSTEVPSFSDKGASSNTPNLSNPELSKVSPFSSDLQGRSPAFSSNPFSSMGASLAFGTNPAPNAPSFNSPFTNPFASGNNTSQAITPTTKPVPVLPFDQPASMTGSNSPMPNPFTTATSPDTQPILPKFSISLDGNPFVRHSGPDDDSGMPNVFGSDEPPSGGRIRRARRRRD